MPVPVPVPVAGRVAYTGGMSTKKNGYHFSISLGHELWDELLRAALPIKLTNGEFHLARDARAAIKQLGMRDRVRGLLEDRNAPTGLIRAKDRAKELWRARRSSVYRRLNDVIRVEGTWKVELDDSGSRFRYGKQKVGADAWLKATCTGTVHLMAQNVELPFTLEKRVGASVTLADVHYDDDHEAVIGRLRDLGVNIGEPLILQMLSRLAEQLLEQQLGNVNPVPILKRQQVDEMVGPMANPIGTQMAVETLQFDLTEDDMSLRIRFGFAHKQIEEQDEEARI